MQKKIITLFVVLLFYSSSFAASLCVTPSGAGSKDGSDWDNALDWSAGITWVRGNSYYLAGFGDSTTYAGGVILNTAASGTDVITIKKATAGDHVSETGWSASYGTSQAVIEGSTGTARVLSVRTPYWTIDGQVGGGPDSWDSGHGIKITTTSTSATAVKLLYISNDTSVSGYDIHHVNFEHIDFAHRGEQDPIQGDDIIYQTKAYEAVYSHTNTSYVTFDHCWLHDPNRTIALTGRNSYWTYQYCMFEENNSYGTPPQHSEAIADYGSSEMTVKYCFFKNVSGTGVIAGKENDDDHFDNWYIHGNIFYQEDDFAPELPKEYGIGMGVVCNTSTTEALAGFDGLYFYNNTIYGYDASSSTNTGVNCVDNGDCTDIYIYNNLWIDNDTCGFLNATDNDYNQYYDTALAWNTTIGDNSNSSTGVAPGDIFTDYENDDFSLIAGIGGTTDTGSPYDVDMYGETRGDDGTWDRGAVEFDDGGSPSNQPPTVLITTPADDPHTASAALVTVSGSASDSDGTISTVTWTCPTCTTTSGSATGTTSWTFDVTCTEGTNTVTVTATDDDSATDDDTVDIYWDEAPVDTTAPTISNMSPVSSDNVPYGNVTLTLDASDVSGVSGCRWDWSQDIYDDMANTMVEDSGTYTGTVPSVQLDPLTSYTVYRRCVDTVGNSTTATPAFSFVTGEVAYPIAPKLGLSGSDLVIGVRGIELTEP